jgi:RHS repeat-associated protein
VVVVNQNQSIQYQTYQDPWGNLEMSVGVPTSNPEFKFTDKELDEDSDLYYFQARYYDGVAGRFISRDRVRLEDDLMTYFQINPFQFTKNNPIRNIDEDGNKDHDVWSFSRNKIMGKITDYGVDYTQVTVKVKGKDVVKSVIEANFNKRTQVVCNEVLYFSAKDKYPTFPYSGSKQADWFKNRGELYDANSTKDLDKIPNLGGGDEIFMYDKKGNFAHALQVNDFDPKTKTFTVMGAHGSASGVNVKAQRYTIDEIKTYWKFDSYKIGSFDPSKSTKGSKK